MIRIDVAYNPSYWKGIYLHNLLGKHKLLLVISHTTVSTIRIRTLDLQAISHKTQWGPPTRTVLICLANINRFMLSWVVSSTLVQLESSYLLRHRRCKRHPTRLRVFLLSASGNVFNLPFLKLYNVALAVTPSLPLISHHGMPSPPWFLFAYDQAGGNLQWFLPLHASPTISLHQ